MTRFDEFVVESLLGEGGMGKVFRARQVALDRWVALKVLPRAKENQTFIDRFYREAKSAARLLHPNIIQIYTVGECQGIPYFAMEYVEGEDVEHLLRPEAGEPFTMDEVIEIIRSVAKALAVATEHGIVHRDIKPANVMVTKSGLVKVMDFGLAKGAATDHALTQQGLIVGTPAYMSPEQGASRDVDSRSDQYSLGCVMYECITGRPPFKADNVASLIFKHMYEQPDAIPTVRADTPPAVEAIVKKMMSKNPAERYQNAAELLEALAMLPTNSSLAEITLAKRVNKLMQARKNKGSKVDKSPSASLAEMGVQQQAAPVQQPAAPPMQQPATQLQSAVKPPSVSPPALSPSNGPALSPSNGPALSPSNGPALSPLPVSRPATPMPVPAGNATVIHKTPDPDRLAPAAFRAAPPEAPPPPAVQPERIEKPVATPVVTPPPRKITSGISPVPSSMPGSMPSPMPGSIPAPPKPVSSSRSPKVITSSPRLAVPVITRIDEAFQKLPDNRWAYKPDLARCPHAEGLASEAPSNAGKSEGLGDCLLCSNWNKRTGCAMAFCQELEAYNRYRGLRLYTEQSIAWSGAGRFDKAIAILDNYVKNNPDDPEGYRELARVYDRPDYKGKDKRRAIVLYSRFLELARTGNTYSNLELTRAEERVNALKTLTPEHHSSDTHAGVGIPFQSFYRGGIVCFGYGLMSGDRLLFARAGEMDPESGTQASEMGGAVTKATSIFRRFKSESAKKEEQAQVKRELMRLSNLAAEMLQKDAAVILSIGFDQITSAEMKVDSAVGIRIIKLHTHQHTHELLFTESGAFRAEQCHALIQRKIKKNA